MLSFKEFLLEHGEAPHKEGGFTKRLKNFNHALSVIYGLGKAKHKHAGPHSVGHAKRRKLDPFVREKIKQNKEKIEAIETKIRPYEDRIKELRLTNKRLRGSTE